MRGYDQPWYEHLLWKIFKYMLITIAAACIYLYFVNKAERDCIKAGNDWSCTSSTYKYRTGVSGRMSCQCNEKGPKD